MEEVKIKIDSKSYDDTSEDVDREEQKWESKGEDYVKSIQAECDKKSQIYNDASHHCKNKYNRYSVPTIVIPIIMGVASSYIPNDYQYITGTTMSFVGILNGLNTFYNYGKKSERFNEYSGKYGELSATISIELSKPKKFRTQLDVFTERISTRKLSLDATAPFI